jgi:hypothetical protein
VGPHFFVTIDAESDVIAQGVPVICELRNEIEAQEQVRLPLTWFVRFQRSWGEYMEGESACDFAGPVTGGFDGFALVREQLLELQARGDEIGWHYHAYHYVYRDDLSHAARLGALEADLEACASELRSRHPELPVQSFRFGWCFVPDYALYRLLARLGFQADASISPNHRGAVVAEHPAVRYLPPLVTGPAHRCGLWLFPRCNTLITHDWSVVAHDFSWSRRDQAGARAEWQRIEHKLREMAAALKRDGGEFITYQAAMQRAELEIAS